MKSPLQYNGRYTLSLHKKPNERAHLDLFLDIGEEKLWHYYLPMPQRKKNQLVQTFWKGFPHRRVYLIKQGNLGNLGRLKIISRGFFQIKKEISSKDCIQVRILQKGKVYGLS